MKLAQALFEDLSDDPRLLGALLLVGALCVGVAYAAVAWLDGNHPVTLQAAKDDGPAPVVHLELIDRVVLSHDTRRLRFRLPSERHVLGLPVGQHVSLRYTDDEGKLVMRSYTPVSSDDTPGYVDLVVKVYFRDVHPKFPDGGKMSQYLEGLQIGQTIAVSGPKGKLTYAGRGELRILHRLRDPAPEVRRARKIAMIAGGTGITPMLQVIRRALRDKDDKTEFYLLFANQTEQDILLREEIDTMAKTHDNVHVWYTIDRDASPEWAYSTGFVNAEMIKAHLPAAAPDVQVLMCGPPPMLKFAVLPALEELGFSPNQHFSF